VVTMEILINKGYCLPLMKNGLSLEFQKNPEASFGLWEFILRKGEQAVFDARKAPNYKGDSPFEDSVSKGQAIVAWDTDPAKPKEYFFDQLLEFYNQLRSEDSHVYHEARWGPEHIRIDDKEFWGEEQRALEGRLTPLMTARVVKENQKYNNFSTIQISTSSGRFSMESALSPWMPGKGRLVVTSHQNLSKFIIPYMLATRGIEGINPEDLENALAPIYKFY